jgi:HAMP domain-containing protein
MLNITANELEDLIQTVTSKRALTEAEEEIVRKQRRLVRNRESAQASRTRKKKRIEELEQQVREITQEKEQALRDLHQTLGENAQLQKTTRFLQELVDRNPVFKPTLVETEPDGVTATTTTTCTSSSSPLSSTTNSSSVPTRRSTRTIKQEKKVPVDSSPAAANNHRRSQNLGVVMLVCLALAVAVAGVITFGD